MSNQPLSADRLEELLDDPLDPALSSRRTATGIAKALAVFDRTKQNFVLRWVGIMTKTNAELAYQFAHNAPQALELMNLPDIEGWIIHAMDVYDKKGLYPACAVLANVQTYAVETSEKSRGVGFDEVAGILELFVRGLAGRELKLEPAEEVYTDTHLLYLPRRMSLFAERDDNFRLYKAMAAHLWAQTWFGTFRVDLSRFSRRFDNPNQALQLFHALEAVRLDARIAAELPGLGADMHGVQRQLQNIAYPSGWAPHMKRLQRPGATVEDTCECVHSLYDGRLPLALCYQGKLFPERVEQVMAQRLAQEKETLQEMLVRLAQDMQDEERPGAEDGKAPAERERQFTLDQRPDPHDPDGFTFELTLEDAPVTPPNDMRALLNSILQDFGEIPPEYLVAAGDGGYHKDGTAEKDPAVEELDHGADVLLYNEWDYRRQHYRKNWCTLRERDVHPNYEPFVQRALTKYAGLVKHLRKTFEVLRGEDKLLKRQIEGDDIDFDALVEAYADVQQGREMPQQLFTKLHKVERNIAVMFMVDMSGSTKGWINDAEREALVLLCETLEILGDRYAIYGFSGMSRKRCELFRVKRFEEPYSDEVRARITGIKPQDYTRMGVTIRHLTKLLESVEARTKLLITLSDGKPDDFDGYRGDYGIEDTRQALIEAKRLGIHPFCITIDHEAREYLPHMYGAVNYTVIDDVRKLPLKVADIYRRLTV